MEISRPLIRSAVLGAVIVALIGGVPAFGADVIHNGVDLWMTVAGYAQTSFAGEPIPAGFFCEGSQPFPGKVAFKGTPRSAGSVPGEQSRAASTPPCAGSTTAAFNDKGEATDTAFTACWRLSMVSVQGRSRRAAASYDVGREPDRRAAGHDDAHPADRGPGWHLFGAAGLSTSRPRSRRSTATRAAGAR